MASQQNKQVHIFVLCTPSSLERIVRVAGVTGETEVALSRHKSKNCFGLYWGDT